MGMNLLYHGCIMCIEARGGVLNDVAEVGGYFIVQYEEESFESLECHNWSPIGTLLSTVSTLICVIFGMHEMEFEFIFEFRIYQTQPQLSGI